LSSLAIKPSQDSSECASVLPSLAWKRNTCTALMPMVVPVRASSRGGSTTCRVEVRVLGPAFQRKTVPGWTRPWSVTDLTSGFQDGHWSMAEITENTVWGSASIRNSPSAVAGASRLICLGVLQVLRRVDRGLVARASHDRRLYRSVGDERRR
jgi:hypothetical protein